mmetsp:Transcript_16736/g.52777  ORF Transcript_16736/g.52777 Transcript_16736/m.52777 type:complete len:215 (-) Transcript_16736:2569-3213(-)
MVPTLYFTLAPFSVNTSSATRLMRASCCASSALVPMRGTMIFTPVTTPSFSTLMAASVMARTCISAISGNAMARRQPRKPSMGLTSESFSMRSSISSTLTPQVWESTSHTSSMSPSGRNSCSGGSSRRTVVGSPSMALKMPSKSLRWKGRICSRASLRGPGSTAMIMRRTAAMRSSSPKNMCSVRQRPMPSAPLRRAASASAGVSALASTVMVR